MKKILVSVLFFSFWFTSFNLNAANRGRYLKGYTVYKYNLGRCSHLWWKFGDITKSNGKIIKSKNSLAQVLGKLPTSVIRKWIADPMSVYPHVNCKPAPFRTETEISDLIYYLRRTAFNPPKKPHIVRVPFIRSKIRLVKTQKLLRERLRVLQNIKKWRFDITQTGRKVKTSKSVKSVKGRK